MKIVVLDAATLGTDLSLAPLAALGDVIIYENTAPDEIEERIADCDVIVQNKIRLGQAAFAAARQLKLVCEMATGYDNIDIAAARMYGVAVCNVPGYSTASVVQVTVAMALSLFTHLPEYRAHVADGVYSAGQVANQLTPVYHELAGKTWGIIGYGAIGRGVAAVAKALGCQIMVCRAHPTSEDHCVDLDTLCQASDIISLHTPLTDSTRGMIDRRLLSLMKPHTILINVARGAVTDEAAVAEALLAGRLGALGIDVYSEEPFRVGHPFFPLRNDARVCMTPHMAWGSFEARTRCLNAVVENIRAFYRGEKKNRVDEA